MDPRFAAAYAAFEANREDEGIELLTAALSAGPGPLHAYKALGARLFNRKRYEEAEQWTRAGLDRTPKDADLWNTLGVILRRQRRLEEAVAALERAQKLNPKSLMPLSNLVNVFNDMQEGAKALAIAQKLVRAQPANPEFHRNMATAYRILGELENAAARLDAALRLQPQNVEAWTDRASLSSMMQKHDEATEVIARGLAANPGNAKLMENHAVLLRRAGRHSEATEFLKAHIAAHPDDAWAHFQLARTLADFDRETANEHYRRAVELVPTNLRYRVALAESLERSRFGDEGANIQEAYEVAKAALTLGSPALTDLPVVRQIALRVGDYALMDSLISFEDIGRRLARASIHGPLLQQLGRVKTPEDRYEVLEQHRLWGETVAGQVARNPIRRPPPRPKDGRIRLGFMSSDLRNHPVGYFALPLFQHIDPRFDVYCYSFFTGPEDATQKFIASKVNAFRWHKTISDRSAAQLAADDQLDMLIELGGSTHMNKLEALAYRPAPLQASWLGYPHSAGLAEIDYLVVDPYIMPEKPGLTIEKPMVMPHTWLCLGAAQFRDSQQINPVTPEERNGFITYGTANNPHKYGPELLRIWARVVAATPGARFLWVRPEGGTPSFCENMRAIFAEEGVDPGRMQFQAVRGAHLPFYNEIDIALDTFPLTGGTTTCETLWMGVPVVSMVGDALFERLSYSLLTNAGLGDLVVRTPEAFVQTALKLAGDPARRRVLRLTLRDQIKASPLYAHEAFARDFYNLVAETLAMAG